MDSEKLFVSMHRQINNLFGITSAEEDILRTFFPKAVERTLFCFKSINTKYYQRAEINPLHSAQYTQFLYYQANTVYKDVILKGGADADNARDLCSKLYILNKSLSACELYYEVELPDIFLLDHPVGSVIGRGKFSNYLLFLQDVTVGANNNLYPEFGEKVVLFEGAQVLGTSHIGNNVVISANAYVKDQDIPDNSIVFGSSPDLIINTGHVDKINEIMEENFILG